MLNEPPTFEVVGELSDDAIEALAALLLSLLDQDESRSQDPEEKTQSA